MSRPRRGRIPRPLWRQSFSNVENARHEVAAKATRKAEEELSRFKVELLKRPATHNQELLNFVLTLWVAQFHIWAKRGVHVVWGDFNIAPYDNWLTWYAESIRKLGSARYHGEIILLTELRVRLLQGIEHWKAEARRCVPRKLDLVNL